MRRAAIICRDVSCRCIEAGWLSCCVGCGPTILREVSHIPVRIESLTSDLGSVLSEASPGLVKEMLALTQSLLLRQVQSHRVAVDQEAVVLVATRPPVPAAPERCRSLRRSLALRRREESSVGVFSSGAAESGV
jgi:hypothetical protein